MLLRIVASFVFLTALSAQTFVVDASGGAGSHYTSLPTAVAAVPDGAVLIVRPGSYQAFAMSGKGLTILGEPGAVVTGEVQIDTTAIGQAVTIRELTWTAPTSGQVLLGLRDCAGPVLLERITQPGGVYSQFVFLHGVGVDATRCEQLTIRESDVLCTARFDTTHAAIERCTVRGEGVLSTGSTGRTAVICQNGTLVVGGASTVIEGGHGMIGGPAAVQPGNGISLFAASLRVVDGAIRSGGVHGNSQSVLYGSAIWPVGVSRVSPRVTLFSSSTFFPQEPTDDVMPALVADGAPLGGTLQAAVETEVGDLVVLVVGLPGASSNVAGFIDPFWLDASEHVFVAIGQQQQGVAVTGAVAVPNNPGLRGFRLHWQAACFGPATGTQVTNPGVSLVR